MNEQFEMIFFILNKGHIDEAMAKAREAGATGGTVITAHGSAAPEFVEKSLGFAVQPEKEILMILSLKEKRSAIMSAISIVAGLNKPGAGIGFSIPVEDVTGLSAFNKED